MPRTLVILRHAKSSWDDPELADHDRPLAKRGRGALPRLQRYIAERALPVELVLCSSARRARQTLDGVIEALGAAPTIRVDQELYLASADQLAQRLEQVDDAVSGVLLVGHNPGIEELLGRLAVTGERPALERLARKVPTGALGELTLTGSWSQLRAQGCHLDAFVVPRDLPG